MIEEQNKKIFVCYLPYDASENEVRNLFSKCGKVDQVIIKKGYGFVEYASARSVPDALRNFQDYSFKGMKIKVSLANNPYDNRKIPSEIKKKIQIKNFYESNRYKFNNDPSYYQGKENNIPLLSDNNDNLAASSKLKFKDRKKRFAHVRPSPKRSFNDSLSDIDAD